MQVMSTLMRWISRELMPMAALKSQRHSVRCIQLVLMALAGLLCPVTQATAGSVTVDETVTGRVTINKQLAANAFFAQPLGNWLIGDVVTARVMTDNNPLANDLTACFATADEAAQYAAQRSSCRGLIRARTPFELREVIRSNGPLYLILDNSYANFIVKKVTVSFEYKKARLPEQAQALRDDLEKLRASMSETFTNADFNIHVKSCGMANAFSDDRTADITLCTELMQELAGLQRDDTLMAVLLHEYGHSLLNKWGEPGANEEDMADQFATAMLLRSGDRGRALLMRWADYWAKKNSAEEARNQLQFGDTHSLSIQRARNIQRSIIESDELLRRWNKMLYRHMTRRGLEQAIAHAGRTEDLDLANEALQRLSVMQKMQSGNASSGAQGSAAKQGGAVRGDSKVAEASERCTMSLQCNSGLACRRHHCESLPSYENPLRQLPTMESVGRGGRCFGDEHCSPGLICSPAFGKCEVE
jgi:hypothetical protein